MPMWVTCLAALLGVTLDSYWRAMLFAVPVAFVLILCFLLYRDTRKPLGFPPGPPWLPVIGSFAPVKSLRSTLGFYHLAWSALAARFGPVVGLRLGLDRIVVVVGRDAVRDVLTRADFDGRPDGFFFRLRTFGERLGVVFTDGAAWHDQRRFCQRHLRKFGFGQRLMDEQVAVEAAALVASLRARSAAPVRMNDAFDVSVLNGLWAMIAGQRFALDDARLTELLDLVHESFRMLDMSGGILNQMPFLRHVAPKLSGYTQLMGVLDRMWAFIENTIADHRKDYDPHDCRDLIDSFLAEMENEKDINTSFTHKQLVSLCLDLFMAGSETTSNTLGFAVLYMMLHPDVQTRAQAQLDAVLGRDRQPGFADRQRLGYVDAVLTEVQRITSVAPVAVAHRALNDTTLQGHFIPEGCTLLVSIWSLHMDEGHWGDPSAFRPERFLDADGKIISDDWLIPFGYGKRRCLGETLAKSSLFVFFASVLHNFTIELPPGADPPSTLGFDGVTLAPKPFFAKLTPR